jgi:hypothetical protein
MVDVLSHSRSMSHLALGAVAYVFIGIVDKNQNTFIITSSYPQIITGELIRSKPYNIVMG